MLASIMKVIAMVRKSDLVRAAVSRSDFKTALKLAKDFKIGITREQASKMARAYECMLYPEFYRQLGINLVDAIEEGKAIVSKLYG